MVAAGAPVCEALPSISWRRAGEQLEGGGGQHTALARQYGVDELLRYGRGGYRVRVRLGTRRRGCKVPLMNWGSRSISRAGCEWIEEETETETEGEGKRKARGQSESEGKGRNK